MRYHLTSGPSFLQRLWQLGCSLKAAIVLASIATALTMVGSLIMHYNPTVFAGMEEQTMGRWLLQAWQRAPLVVIWVPLTGLCVCLLALNTCCCLIDWLSTIRNRWRKTGEYLVHAGFILLTVAYLWGNTTGFRSGPHRLFPGEELTLPQMPGYTLRLEAFTPRMDPSGRPLDMINEVTLHKGSQQVARATVRTNHPLLYDGLIILPTSFGQELQGFRFHVPTRGFVNLAAGSRLPLSPELTLIVHRLLPDARRDQRGNIRQSGNHLNNPAMQMALHDADGPIWQGWYFLRQPLPAELSSAGVVLRPTEPLFRTFSVLTVNQDPGDKLALAGGLCLSVGVVLAFFSFYRKRARGDRPEV